MNSNTQSQLMTFKHKFAGTRFLSPPRTRQSTDGVCARSRGGRSFARADSEGGGRCEARFGSKLM